MKMKQRSDQELWLLKVLTVCCFVLSVSSRSVEGYKNYTVGDSLGWFDRLMKPQLDYQQWASGKNFSLGDFLIFNTDNNRSVVQTYNFTTYKLCDYDNALDNDTTEWSAGNPSATEPHPVTVAVPMVKEGMNYFFSGDYDGDQCRNGQQLKVNVAHGQGLPKSLQDPSSSSSDQAPSPVSPDVGDDEAAPDTIVPASFDHPKEVVGDNNETSGAHPVFCRLLDGRLNKALIFTGMLFHFMH